MFNFIKKAGTANTTDDKDRRKKEKKDRKDKQKRDRTLLTNEEVLRLDEVSFFLFDVYGTTSFENLIINV